MMVHITDGPRLETAHLHNKSKNFSSRHPIVMGSTIGAMAKKEFFAIGHITNDTLPTPHVGGGVSYTAYSAKQLGYEAHIITKAPEQSRFVQELQALGIIVHCLPIIDLKNAEKVTSFANVDDVYGRRKQYVSETQEKIEVSDIQHFPHIPESALVMVAPVIGEVSPNALKALSSHHKIAVTPQGYFRSIESDGAVRRSRWEEMSSLKNAWLSVLSNEDISFDQSQIADVSTQENLRKIAPLLSITAGENGSELSFSGRAKRIHIEALPLKPQELQDFTGAGDTYAFAFLSTFAETRDPVEAGVFASLFSALKIADIAEGGKGLATVPNLSLIQKFRKAYPKRMRDFLASNGVSEQKSFR